MKIRFYHDPDTGEPHIYGHGVDEDEVADVLPECDAKGRIIVPMEWTKTKSPTCWRGPAKIALAARDRGSPLARRGQGAT
jgi:hypothetical protein